MKRIAPPTAEQVSKLRASSGLDATEFGELVHFGRDAVYSWEAGRRQCHAATWELLLIMFGKAKPRIVKKAKQ